jgi:hypothetical protein
MRAWQEERVQHARGSAAAAATALPPPPPDGAKKAKPVRKPQPRHRRLVPPQRGDPGPRGVRVGTAGQHGQGSEGARRQGRRPGRVSCLCVLVRGRMRAGCMRALPPQTKPASFDAPSGRAAGTGRCGMTDAAASGRYEADGFEGLGPGPPCPRGAGAPAAGAAPWCAWFPRRHLMPRRRPTAPRQTGALPKAQTVTPRGDATAGRPSSRREWPSSRLSFGLTFLSPVTPVITILVITCTTGPPPTGQLTVAFVLVGRPAWWGARMAAAPPARLAPWVLSRRRRNRPRPRPRAAARPAPTRRAPQDA